MRRSSRIKRIDYRTFNKSGEKVSKNETNVDELSILLKDISLDETKMEKLIFEIETIAEDINDFFEEYSLKELITNLRSLCRCKDKELRSASNYDDKFKLIFESNMDKIKQYIIGANDARNKLRMKDFILTQEKKVKVEKEASFQIENASRQLDGIEDEVNVNLDAMSKEELQRRRDGLTALTTRLNDVSKLIPSIIKNMEEDIDDSILTRYNDATSSVNVYSKNVKKLMEAKEVEKEMSFQESKLNINLESSKATNFKKTYTPSKMTLKNYALLILLKD